MKEKELILPDDWEVKEVVGNKIIIKKKEKELPKTWKECAIIIDSVDTVNADSEINSFDISCLSEPINEEDHKIVPEGLGKSMLALCKLLICRNAWWKQLGWEPDWKNGIKKYCITCIGGEISNQSVYQSASILVFPTEEARNQFFESFRDLIEEAKELI